MHRCSKYHMAECKHNNIIKKKDISAIYDIYFGQGRNVIWCKIHVFSDIPARGWLLMFLVVTAYRTFWLVEISRRIRVINVKVHVINDCSKFRNLLLIYYFLEKLLMKENIQCWSTMFFTIVLPNSVVIEIEVDHRANGQECLDQVW